jgi:hypothetical protein
MEEIESIQLNGRSAFFDLRKRSRSRYLDLAGHWSYPAFLPNQNEVYWLYLILPAGRIPDKKIVFLYSPKASLITEPNSRAIVHYDNFSLGHNPFNEKGGTKKGVFPHKSVSDLTPKQLLQKEKELLEICEKESPVFAREKKLSESFRNAWLGLIHPIFLLYLRYLTPEFFKALNVEKRV